MIGIIITGHGNFGDGIKSSLDLIAGNQENLKIVNFDGNGTDKLTADLKQAMEEMKECNGILVFSDLPGGSPFKIAVESSVDYPNVRVIAGTNLPMVCEIAMARSFIDDVDQLLDMAINAGKDAIMKWETPKAAPKEDDDFSDGI